MTVKNFDLKKFLYISFTAFIFVMLIVVKLVFNGLNNGDYELTFIWMRVLSLVGWVTLFWSIATWNSLRKELLCLYVVFLTLMYLFTYGQSLLILFNAVSEQYDLLNQTSESQLVNAQIFTLMGLVLFHLGAMISCKRSADIAVVKDQINEKAMLIAIKYTGILLLLFSLPGFLYDTGRSLSLVASGGYATLFGYDGRVQAASLAIRIFQFTSSYFLPGLICLLIATKEKVLARRTILALMAIYMLNCLYIGGRSDMMILMIVITLIYHYSINPIKLKKGLLLILLLYIVLSFLAVVAQIRINAGRGIADYFVVFLDQFGKENLFFKTLSEIGGSMFPLIAVMDMIPSRYNFLFGKSYFFALTAIIPNLGFWDLHPAQVYASGGTWLMGAMHLSSGPAFTLIADAFRNFGWLGPLVMIGFGLLFGYFFSKIDTSTIKVRPDLFCIIMILFNATVMCVRGDNLYIVRPLVYVVIPIYILMKFLYKEFNREGRL